jgi:large subunit ribosomal protein L28
MARCRFTGKKPLLVNKISHSNRKVKQRRQPNVQTKRVWDEENKKFVRLRVSTRALRTITKNGLAKAARDAGIEIA